MGGLHLWHWVVVALVILVLFGRGKISETMGDFGKGIRSFKKGLGEEESRTPPPPPPPQIAPPPSPQSEQAAPAPTSSDSTTKHE